MLATPRWAICSNKPATIAARWMGIGLLSPSTARSWAIGALAAVALGLTFMRGSCLRVSLLVNRPNQEQSVPVLHG